MILFVLASMMMAHFGIDRMELFERLCKWRCTDNPWLNSYKSGDDTKARYKNFVVSKSESSTRMEWISPRHFSIFMGSLLNFTSVYETSSRVLYFTSHWQARVGRATVSTCWQDLNLHTRHERAVKQFSFVQRFPNDFSTPQLKIAWAHIRTNSFLGSLHVVNSISGHQLFLLHSTKRCFLTKFPLFAFTPSS